MRNKKLSKILQNKKKITESLEQNDIKKLVDVINSELEYQNFINMDVSVDESAFEPSVTIFIDWFDDTFSSKQANLIREEFNLFKTTEHLNGAEIYTEEDVNTNVDVDGNETSEGSVRFVAIIDPEIEITDEFANEVAVAYVQQLTNFWDEVYSEEMLKDRYEENLNENISKVNLFKDIKKLNEELNSLIEDDSDINEDEFTDKVDVNFDISLYEYGVARNPKNDMTLIGTTPNDEGGYSDYTVMYISFDDVKDVLENNMEDGFFDFIDEPKEEVLSKLDNEHLATYIQSINSYNGWWSDQAYYQS